MTFTQAQSAHVAAQITNWHGNATGAYSLCHDDFCDWSVDGIRDYADTIAANRGIKFTFGAITGECEIRPGYYDLAVTMMKKHGHELINHTHTHSCALFNRDCGGQGSYYGWSEPSRQRFDIEMDRSTKSIFTNTGLYPRFFIYPYDQFDNASDEHLHKLNYIGSRTGEYDALNDPDFQPDSIGFFHPALVVDVVETPHEIWAQHLNEWVDSAIISQGWVLRECHNVGPSGWGHINESNYRQHMDYLKEKSNSNALWVATISEVLSYQIQKVSFDTTYAEYDRTSNQIKLHWDQPSFAKLSSYLDSITFKSPVTLYVELYSISYDSLLIVQGSDTISDYIITDSSVVFDAYPHKGPIYLLDAGKITAVQSALPVQKSDINTIPNPFQGEAIVLVNGVPGAWYTLTLYDALGHTTSPSVQAQSGESKTIGNDLPPGMYILNVSGNNSNVSLRILKQ
ncbi:MAG: T9SS type A sorting domain-containing protein [Cytophagaceae bacterium]|nr:T9SS type A sorting domain-containing protein [Cytophagaceae bacterium]